VYFPGLTALSLVSTAENQTFTDFKAFVRTRGASMGSRQDSAPQPFDFTV
jgi:hypothetical protein